MKTVFLLFLPLIFLFTSCIEATHPHKALPPGKWRGVIELDPKEPVNPDYDKIKANELRDIKFQDTYAGEIPFNFEVVYTSDTDFYLIFTNGDEKIKVEDIYFGPDDKTAKDTIQINFPIGRTSFNGIFSEKIIQGVWTVHDKKNYSIPFVATYGLDYRFSRLKTPPKLDMTGDWEVTFSEGKNTSKAIGQFNQNGNNLTGTFVTETGDYRYLQGNIIGEKFFLSAFDGSHAFLFHGKITPNNELMGEFRSGTHYKSLWTAQRNPDFKLTSPYLKTTVLDAYKNKSFDIPTLPDGTKIDLNSKEFQGPKIIQITGSWCPNCRDEANFVSNYLKENPSNKVSFIALAFERTDNPKEGKSIVSRYKEKMNIPYTMFYAGKAGKTGTQNILPMLEKVESYPTMIFLDKNNMIQKIHTGFTGPATKEYEGFKKEFTEILTKL